MKIKQVIWCYFSIYKNMMFSLRFLKNHISDLFLLLVLSLVSENYSNLCSRETVVKQCEKKG